ncbi:hypothetical protein D9M69_627850 [compost metagenome]
MVSGLLSADKLPDLEMYAYASGIMHIDGYIIADQIGAHDKDAFLQVVTHSFSTAKLHYETIKIAKEAVSAISRRSAIARHKDTNRLKQKALIEWDATGASYSSRAAYARHNHKKYDVTERVFYGWIAEHEKAKR